MTRIIGGRYRGFVLTSPAKGTRPTADRVRESLFAILDHQIGDWASENVWDTCAGTGALGLEAASRGAAAVTLVDSSARAVAVIRKNVERLHADMVHIAHADAWTYVTQQQFSLIFIDPPYDVPDERIHSLLDHAVNTGMVTSDCLVVVERRSPATFKFRSNWHEFDRRAYGDTAIVVGYMPEMSAST